MDADGYRKKPSHTIELKVKAVQEAANDETLLSLRDMAIIDPVRRASASMMPKRVPTVRERDGAPIPF